MTRIAVDAMGGDFAPRELVLGVIQAAEKLSEVELSLVGDPGQIQPLLDGHDGSARERIHVVPAEQVVGMQEKPVEAIRKKPGSSVVKAVGMVAQGKADSVISAGNTGAMVAACTLGLGPLQGAKRPGIAVNFPTDTGFCTTIDVGANIQPRPAHLLQYAVMASAYSEVILGVDNPRVGLLNVGGEEGKGPELVREVHSLLAASSLNFVGNVEARDIHRGVCDVLVCDGFVGNVVLKLIEGVGEKLFRMVLEGLASVSAEVAQTYAPLIRSISNRVDYSQYGGAPLLGVNGIAIIGHGHSNATAVANAVRVADEFSRYHLNEIFVQRLSKTDSQ